MFKNCFNGSNSQNPLPLFTSCPARAVRCSAQFNRSLPVESFKASSLSKVSHQLQGINLRHLDLGTTFHHRKLPHGCQPVEVFFGVRLIFRSGCDPWHSEWKGGFGVTDVRSDSGPLKEKIVRVCVTVLEKLASQNDRGHQISETLFVHGPRLRDVTAHW